MVRIFRRWDGCYATKTEEEGGERETDEGQVVHHVPVWHMLEYTHTHTSNGNVLVDTGSQGPCINLRPSNKQLVNIKFTKET